MSATPILDREQPLPEGKKKRRWWPWLVGPIIGALFGWWAEMGDSADTVPPFPLLLPLAVILALYLAILVNLLGHLIAGMAAGFEIRSLAWGGFFVDKQARRWRLRFVPKRLFAGFLHMTPVSTENLARRYAWFLAGGLAATIALLLFTSLALPKGYFERVLLFANLFMAAYCCIPFTFRGTSSPARQLMILARKGADAERLAAIMYLVAIDAQGTRPSSWPREFLEKIGAPGKDRPLWPASLALRYAAARDSNDPEAVAGALENALALIDEMPPDTRRFFLASAACFHASVRNQPSVAEEWLESARKVKRTVLSEKDWDSKTVGLIALAKKDAGAAQESLTRYLAFVDKRPQPLCGMLVAERDRTMALLKQAVRLPPRIAIRPLIAVLLACAAISLSSAQTAPAWKEFSIGPPTRNATRTSRQGITAEGIPLQRAIARAYGVPEYLVLGPSWIADARYAITALVADPKDFQPLFQQELSQRFHLAAHREMRDLPVYLLQPIAGLPHKLANSSGGGGGNMSTGSFRLPNTTVTQFANQLADFVGRPVIDETGIAERYDISLSWGRGDASLSEAVKDQLGLQLIAAQRSVEVLVVDRVDKLEFPEAPKPAGGPAADLGVRPTPEQDISGDWRGILNTGGGGYRLVLHFARSANGGWIGTVDNLDRDGSMGHPYSSVSFENSMLRLTQTLHGVTGRYEGKLDGAGAIQGAWKQQGLTIPVTLTRDSTAKTSPVKASEFTGAWQGDLDLGLAALWLIVHIENGPNGTKAPLDSPDQEGPAVPASSAQIDGAFLTMEWKGIDAAYKGRLNNDHTVIEGLFTQGAIEQELTLKPVKDAAELVRRRPQTPVKPYPYREERVHYLNPSGRIRLGATLTIPAGRGPFPAAILIAGSGPLDRDEDVNGHLVFLVLSDYLTRHGFAVLRADKRGVGESTGDFSEALTTDFASDVEAGVSYLKTRKDVDAHKIGLIGHSEGALIAPMVAAKRSGDVAFLVLMAGPGVPGDEFAAEQTRTLMEARGEALGADVPVNGYLPFQPNTPWLRAFLTIDPADALRKVACPALAINGSKDRQVLPGPNLAGIRTALESGGNPHFEVQELPGLNHLFQTAETGWPREYGHIEETIAPAALDKISSWIGKWLPANGR